MIHFNVSRLGDLYKKSYLIYSLFIGLLNSKVELGFLFLKIFKLYRSDYDAMTQYSL